MTASTARARAVCVDSCRPELVKPSGMIFGRFSGQFSRNWALKAAGLVAFAALCAGCAKQGEGERCDTRNDNRDCESGLICTSLSSLNRGSEGAVCCPDDRSNSSAAICETLPLNFGDEESTDGAMTTDTASTDGAATDGAATDNAMSTDTTASDVSATDATATDAAATDATATDATATDATASDVSATDATSTDSAVTDTTSLDAGAADAGDASDQIPLP